MSVLRWFLTVVVMFCLAASFHRAQFDGVSLIGLAAFALLLWTFDVFTREFWVDDNPIYAAIDEDLDRMERAAREAAQALK